MKNTNRKDFHTDVEVDVSVTVIYEGFRWTFKNEPCMVPKSLYDMCEFMIDEDLQNFWDGQLDLSEANWGAEDKERDRLMNLVKIVFN